MGKHKISLLKLKLKLSEGLNCEEDAWIEPKALELLMQKTWPQKLSEFQNINLRGVAIVQQIFTNFIILKHFFWNCAVCVYVKNKRWHWLDWTQIRNNGTSKPRNKANKNHFQLYVFPLKVSNKSIDKLLSDK